MWPFKKDPEQMARAPQPRAQTVTLNANDTLHERASKIWQLLGFVNDRFGAVASIIGYLATYQELDRKLAAMKQQSTAAAPKRRRKKRS